MTRNKPLIVAMLAGAIIQQSHAAAKPSEDVQNIAYVRAAQAGALPTGVQNEQLFVIQRNQEDMSRRQEEMSRKIEELERQQKERQQKDTTILLHRGKASQVAPAPVSQVAQDKNNGTIASPIDQSKMTTSSLATTSQGNINIPAAALASLPNPQQGLLTLEEKAKAQQRQTPPDRRGASRSVASPSKEAYDKKIERAASIRSTKFNLPAGAPEGSTYIFQTTAELNELQKEYNAKIEKIKNECARIIRDLDVKNFGVNDPKISIENPPKNLSPKELRIWKEKKRFIHGMENYNKTHPDKITLLEFIHRGLKKEIEEVNRKYHGKFIELAESVSGFFAQEKLERQEPEDVWKDINSGACCLIQ